MSRRCPGIPETQGEMMAKSIKAAKAVKSAKAVKNDVAKAKLEMEDTTVQPTILIPSGATLLNLSLSDSPEGGYATGTITNIIGDSSAGKSLLAHSMLASCANDKRFNKHLLIYDDVEAACQFDLSRLFGQKYTDRVCAPYTDEDGAPASSDTIQEWLIYMKKLLDKGKPFVYILDSFDALTSEETEDYIDEVEKAHDKNKDMPGQFGAEKAKWSSKILSYLKKKLKDTDSFVLIVSQTRENLSPGSFQKKVRSGGKALEFYSSAIMWLAVADRLKKTVNKKERQIGVLTKIQITKSRLTGKVRDVTLPIYYYYGIDDTRSLVGWLIDNGVWKGEKTIVAEELDIVASKEKLIQMIEEQGLEDKVIALVSKTWRSIERALVPERKKRFE